MVRKSSFWGELFLVEIELNSLKYLWCTLTSVSSRISYCVTFAGSRMLHCRYFRRIWWERRGKKSYAYKIYLMVYKTPRWIHTSIKKKKEKTKKLSLNGNALLFTKVPIRPTKTRGWCVSICLWIIIIFFLFCLLECAHILCKNKLLLFSYLTNLRLHCLPSFVMVMLFVHQIGKLKGKKIQIRNLLCWID